MRWFVACSLEEGAQRAIAREVETARAALGVEGHGVRWVPPAKWHITLAFLGAVELSVADRVKAAFRAPFPLRPFSLTVGGLGVFPSEARPRVLWAGVTEGAAEVAALQRAVVDRLEQAGWVATEQERRPFRPHVTVGRIRVPSRDLRAGLTRVLGAPVKATGRSAVEHVTLFDSHVVDRGPVYEVVARAPLC